ncbi:MAG: phosphate ABC transporter permease subunit PstC [Pseudomonadota bacterium]
MPFAWYAFVLLAAAGMASYTAGRVQALFLKFQSGKALRSSEGLHGIFILMATCLPMFLGLAVLASVDGPIVRGALVSELPERLLALPTVQLDQYLEQLWYLTGQSDVQLSDPFDDAARWRIVALMGQVRLVGGGSIVAMGLAGYWFASRFQTVDAPIRDYLETTLRMIFFASAAVAVLITIGILASLVFQGVRFFAFVNPLDFLFGTSWNPSNNQDFGAIPLFFGTIGIAIIAMAVAAPIGILSAIYLSEYASPSFRRVAKPAMEVLAGIPTVVYGFFAILLVAPIIRSLARSVNQLTWVPDGFLAAQPNSALAAGLVMGIMIIPFVSSVTDGVLRSVPDEYREGALALGSTRAEMILRIVLPAARPGIFAALLLGVSRAVGETMIVVMAAGQRAQITLDATSDMTTVTAQIVSLLIGDSAFDSPRTLSAFALGGVLFLVTVIFNLIALRVVRQYRTAYG